MKNVVAVVWPLIGAGESCGASEMLDIFLGEEKKKIRGVDVSKRNDFCRVFERWWTGKKKKGRPAWGE